MALPKETKEQEAVVKWLRNNGHLVFSIPNGGRKSVAEAVVAKRTGEVAGWPDLGVALKKGLIVWVEMKRRAGGVVSPAQKKIHAQLRALGHVVILAKGAKDAVTQLRELGL